MRIKDLENYKEKILNKDFDFSRLNITSLEGSPKKIDGDFNCSDNNITSLKGAPKEVNGDFDCSINRITSLDGGPKIVRGDFNSRYNLRLGFFKILRYYLNTEISGEFKCDFDFERFQSLDNREKIKYVFDEEIFKGI